MNKKLTKKQFDLLRQRVKSRNARIFIIMLVASALVWFFEKMRQNYTVVVEAQVVCTNVPKGYRMSTDELPPVRIMVNSEGSNLFWNFDQKHPMKIEVDVSTLRRRQADGAQWASFYPRRNDSYIQSLLPEHVEMRSILTDSIPIPLFIVKNKVVPVRLNQQATLESQYLFSRSPELKPSAVVIEGPANVLDSLDYIDTEQLAPIVVNDTISLSAKLVLPTDVLADAPNVQITYFAETYTEKQIEVPIRAINTPEGFTFKAFPDHVQVNMNVGVSCFELVSASDFDVVVDLAEVSLGSNNSKIKLRLEGQPPHVQNVSYSPLFVEYLLERTKKR